MNHATYYYVHPSPKAEPFKQWLAKLGRNALKKSKTQNSPLIAPVNIIRQRDTRITGLKPESKKSAKNYSEVSKFFRNLRATQLIITHKCCVFRLLLILYHSQYIVKLIFRASPPFMSSGVPNLPPFGSLSDSPRSVQTG